MTAITIQIAGMRIAALLGRKETDGWAFVRCAREMGLIETGRGGRGGTGAIIADVRKTILLLFAMVYGGAVRESLSRASEACGLPYDFSARSFVSLSGEHVCSVPPSGPVSEALTCEDFAGVVASIINAYRLGVRLDEFPNADKSVRLHGLRIGQLGGSPFAIIENRSIAPNVDGYFTVDMCSFDVKEETPDGSSIERSVFIPVAYLEGVAKILGPLAVGGGRLRADLPVLRDEDADEEADIGIAAAGDGNPRSAEVH